MAPFVVLVLGWVVALVPAWFAPPTTDGGEPTFQFLATLLAVLVLAPTVVLLGGVTAVLGARSPDGRRRTAVRVLGGITWVLAVGPALVLGAWFNQAGWGLVGLAVFTVVWMALLVRGLRFAAGYVPER